MRPDATEPPVINWGQSPATGAPVAQGEATQHDSRTPLAPQPSQVPTHLSAGPNPGIGRIAVGPVIRVGRRTASPEGGPVAEVFTMSLGGETIDLLPFRNWGQLDIYKWRVQGKLPGTPAGLEITPDHIKVAGETVKATDTEACTKLEQLFNQWLEVENKSLALARKKPRVLPATVAGGLGKEDQSPLQFRVEMDKRGQVHIHCMRGLETVASIGLSVSGLNGLANQGLLRKPRALDVGALHDWIELDGELCSFEHGNNDAAKLERLLNEHYVPAAAASQGKDILIFANPASPTGFDIQFPVTVGGLQENRRRTLNDAALELLQEPVRCGLLQPGLILKISPPSLIIKRKTADGGEAYLEKGPAHTVALGGDDGGERQVDLSQPVNYTHLNVIELASVFNHPAINRHHKSPSGPLAAAPVEAPSPALAQRPLPPHLAMAPKPTASANQVTSPAQAGNRNGTPEPRRQAPMTSAEGAQKLVAAPPSPQPATAPAALPNAWLGGALGQVPIRYDWLACLLYRQVAEYFHNSGEAELKLGRCWRVALNSLEQPPDAPSRWLFLTQKGGLGFIGGGRMARFNRGVAFIGTQEAVLEGIDVHLAAVGLFDRDHIAFVIRDSFRSKFGVQETIVGQELKSLSEAGASLLTIREVLESPRALEIVWTVPAEQANPADPQACQNRRPGPGTATSSAERNR